MRGSLRDQHDTDHQAMPDWMLGKISERLNIPTERLAGLRAAADATGISFEELTGAMQKMLVAVSGSGDPLKKAAADTAFNKLGIAAAALKNLAPEQQFAAIADALSKVANVADRVNIAKSLFGRGDVPILNILKDGSKGLEQWQRFAEKSGIALTKIDVSKVERAHQSVRAMFLSFQGLTDQIVVKLSPAIDHLGKLFTYLSQTVLPFLQKHAEFLVALIKIAIAYKAAVWAVVAAERALAVATAIKIAITSESWAALARLAAGAVVAGAAVAGIYIAFKKVEEGIDKIKLDIPDIPDLPEMADALKGDMLPKNPGAFLKGSVEAYSAIVNAGGSPMSKIEQHTKASAKSLQNIEKGKGGMAIQPANLGGRK